MEFYCPSQTLLSVIHPGIVRDVDRAIASIGGTSAMQKIADDPVTSVLELRFRPQDRFEHPIASCTAKTSNILVKVNKSVTEDVHNLGCSHTSAYFLGYSANAARARGHD